MVRLSILVVLTPAKAQVIGVIVIYVLEELWQVGLVYSVH
jgi:hypothetical protein